MENEHDITTLIAKRTEHIGKECLRGGADENAYYHAQDAEEHARAGGFHYAFQTNLEAESGPLLVALTVPQANRCFFDGKSPLARAYALTSHAAKLHCENIPELNNLLRPEPPKYTSGRFILDTTKTFASIIGNCITALYRRIASSSTPPKSDQSPECPKLGTLEMALLSDIFLQEKLRENLPPAGVRYFFDSRDRFAKRALPLCSVMRDYNNAIREGVTTPYDAHIISQSQNLEREIIKLLDPKPAKERA